MSPSSGPAAGPPALPEALTGHAGYLAVRFGQRARELFVAGIADLDLRPAYYDYLATVHERGPLSQTGLAQALGVEAARIVAVTDALQARGAVARTVDPRDRRRNLLTLSAEGRALLARARRVADAVEDQLLEQLAPQERVVLRVLMRRVLGLEPEPPTARPASGRGRRGAPTT